MAIKIINWTEPHLFTMVFNAFQWGNFIGSPFHMCLLRLSNTLRILEFNNYFLIFYLHWLLLKLKKGKYKGLYIVLCGLISMVITLFNDRLEIANCMFHVKNMNIKFSLAMSIFLWFGIATKVEYVMSCSYSSIRLQVNKEQHVKIYRSLIPFFLFLFLD